MDGFGLLNHIVKKQFIEIYFFKIAAKMTKRCRMDNLGKPLGDLQKTL